MRYLLLDLAGVIIFLYAFIGILEFSNTSFPIYIHAFFWHVYWIHQGCVGK